MFQSNNRKLIFQSKNRKQTLFESTKATICRSVSVVVGYIFGSQVYQKHNMNIGREQKKKANKD